MAKVRDILIHVSVETAQRQRICRRGQGRLIAKGQRCLVVLTNATDDPYSYSVEPSKAMLDAAWIKLNFFYAELGLAPPNA